MHICMHYVHLCRVGPGGRTIPGKLDESSSKYMSRHLVAYVHALFRGVQQAAVVARIIPGDVISHILYIYPGTPCTLAEEPHSKYAGLLHCTYAGAPHRRHAGVPHCTYAGIPHCTCAGIPHCTYAGVPHCTYAGVLHCTYAEVAPCTYAGGPHRTFASTMYISADWHFCGLL